MADFDPPWATDGERRAPISDEVQGGFGCGDADLALFNWMFWAIWSEIGEVLTFNGITPSNSDMTQLRQAIQAQIDAATGGGDPSSYLTLLQASSRLPIFPEAQTTEGHLSVVTPATGQVRVPAGKAFLHRGISPYTTAQTDLATDASKTYHLRWNKTDGFTLKDLASGTYNPGALAETESAFDSTFDDVLFARVITNSSNVPTITNLVNKSRLDVTEVVAGTNVQLSGANGSLFAVQKTLNWARKPGMLSYSIALMGNNDAGPDVDHGFFGPSVTYPTLGPPGPYYDRYQIASRVMWDFATSLSVNFAASA
ncbi:hypothetical protein HFO32_10735 [Rhizobium leguminosarum]|uniref:hypothetical protein n=1 Tax=Rhizobium leguminosarum TaxID=384 RepID=UPI001C945F12|nr:hypothetical protein [Rhizobium leguminosarum]MBY5682632.1 hypothetical protein [Rhizobium leguminosarum]